MSIAIPRFAAKPFNLLSTPQNLQSVLMNEYRSMDFHPLSDTPQFDSDYGESVVHGVSFKEDSVPNLDYSPISSELLELAYTTITPMIENWAGCKLERSWGYGIRSYGPGSKLHVHRDRVETHVISCIVHVDDKSSTPWPLNFIDHWGKLHEVFFLPGQMLFYESLCPHARVQPFTGEYYRNMYLHWRPVDWDPTPYSEVRCKFPSLQEAQQDCVKAFSSDRSVLLPEDWKEWLRLNHSRGCDRRGMIQKAQESGGFSDTVVEAFLDSLDSVLPSVDESRSSSQWLKWFEAPLTHPDNSPRAWKLDTPLAQVYEIPDLLSQEDCELLIDAINRQLIPSSVTTGKPCYRTSSTCHLQGIDPELTGRIDEYLSSLLGVDPSFSEPLQGQYYAKGQYFKEHTDWFAPGTEEYAYHAGIGGQRTWTVMVYLNTVERGGKTCFKHLNRCFAPVQGSALAWNNLTVDGVPNSFTLHEAMPVDEGEKWVITKWFRARPGRNSLPAV